MRYSTKFLVLMVVVCMVAAIIGWRLASTPKRNVAASALVGPSESLSAAQHEATPSRSFPVQGGALSRTPPRHVFQLLNTDEDSEASMGFIYGHDRSAGMTSRAKAIRDLRSDLSYAEINVLYKLMAKTNGQDPLPAELLNVVKNEAASILMSQEKLPQFYASNLCAMYLDDRYDSTWREYCLQFLGRSFPKLPAAEKSDVVSVLWAAAERLEFSMAGTALTALQLNADDESIDRERVISFSRSLISDQGILMDIRVTALQVCAELGDRVVLPQASQLASSKSTPLRLRLSAIGAIGLLGDSKNRAELEEYASQGDKVIRLAADTALKRLSI